MVVIIEAILSPFAANVDEMLSMLAITDVLNIVDIGFTAIGFIGFPDVK